MLGQISARSPLAEESRYAVKLKPQLLACAEDGQLEINNNLAENALLDMALDKERQMKKFNPL